MRDDGEIADMGEVGHGFPDGWRVRRKIGVARCQFNRRKECEIKDLRLVSGGDRGFQASSSGKVCALAWPGRRG
jgi:hypothetical protein